MKYVRFILALIALAIAPSAFAASNIVGPQQYSQFIGVDIDKNGTDDFINWAPTGYGATVTDTAITGKIWGESVGWINLNPAGSYTVTNTCDGTVGGWAWGQNTGWINFHATGGNVSINTTTGKITGSVWAQNYGWIKLSSPETPTGTSYNPALGLVTSWHGCAGGTGGSGGSSGGSVVPVTQCNDHLDNDGDGLTDPLDPGCHSDGNADNPASYTPWGTSELNGLPGMPLPAPSTPAVPSTPGTPSLFPPVNGTGTSGTGTGSSPITIIPIPGGSAAPIITIPFKWIMPILGLIGILSTIPGLATRFINLALTFVFARKKQRGVVYDAKTKQPLDPVYVTVVDATGKEVGNQITDIHGRYGFVLPPGTYRMTAGKTHYEFPSKLMVGKTRDEVYDNLYFGESFTVENGDAVTTMNIPMDPVGTDWNQEEKKRMNLWKWFGDHSHAWAVLFEFLFVIGFAGSVIITYLYPVWWNILMVALYVLIAVGYEFGWSQVSAGHITKAGKPLQNAIVRAFGATLNREVAHKVTTENGGYYMLIAKGDYYITVEERQTDGTYAKVYTSSPMRASHGVINKSLDL